MQHYEKMGNKRKVKAAKFLISNMDENKYWFEGDVLSHYDEVLFTYDSLRREGIYRGDPSIVLEKWDNLVEKYGLIHENKLITIYDNQVLKADFLIKNIDQAFMAWENSSFYNVDDFDLFCEYILPYRVQNEPIEVYRERYYNDLKLIIDTAHSVKSIIQNFHQELSRNRQYHVSGLLWYYPIEIPISKMEIARRGSCRQLTTFQALIMRACGLPVSIDRSVWGNRSQGHSWNVF